jgi:hypothetical protein
MFETKVFEKNETRFCVQHAFLASLNGVRSIRNYFCVVLEAVTDEVNRNFCALYTFIIC